MASRKRKPGDESYNARRRYYRSAQRYLSKAEKSSGATAARYRALAKVDAEKAIRTYDVGSSIQRLSKPIRNLSDMLGIDVDEVLERRKRAVGEFADKQLKSYERKRRRLIEESRTSLESALEDPETRRQLEAEALFANPKISKRLLGGFVDIWRDKAVDYETGKIDNEQILPALYDYFDVDNLADLIEKVEDIVGDKLFADEDSDIMYEAVKLLIQVKLEDDSVIS